MNQANEATTGRPCKIEVAIPSRNLAGQELCGGLAAALVQMKQDCRWDVTVKIWPGFGVDIVRNQIVAAFLTSDAQFLLMLDDDVIPPADLLEMTAHDCDIVGALYYGWNPDNGPFVVAYRQDNNGDYIRPGLPGKVENTGLQEAAMVGGGCLLIHRRVLAALPAPWFRFETDAARQMIRLPEDFLFCRTAIENGFKVFLDTDRVCGHIKRIDLRDVATILAERRKRKDLFDPLR